MHRVIASIIIRLLNFSLTYIQSIIIIFTLAELFTVMMVSLTSYGWEKVVIAPLVIALGVAVDIGETVNFGKNEFITFFMISGLIFTIVELIIQKVFNIKLALSLKHSVIFLTLIHVAALVISYFKIDTSFPLVIILFYFVALANLCLIYLISFIKKSLIIIESKI